jgi:hypothetical protein
VVKNQAFTKQDRAVLPNLHCFVWTTDNSNNEDGFKIYRGDSPSTLTLTDTVGPNTTSCEDTELTRKTVYYYQVCAYNAEGEGCSAIIETKTK